MVNKPAPGPSITLGPDGSTSSSVLDSVIVCGVPKTDGSNWMMLPARLALASACSITYTRSPEVPEPAPVVVVALTVYTVGEPIVVGRSKAPMSTIPWIVLG